MKKFKYLIIGFVLGALIFGGGVYAVTLINSSDVTYTPDSSLEWNVSNVSDALDELYNMANNNILNDVKTWLRIGRLNKDYTSISQVLEDSNTFKTLINNENACNYLKDSLEWINPIISNETAMTIIGDNDSCADTLFSNDDWGYGFAESNYFDKVLKPLVPTMTSATAPSGQVFGSSGNPFNKYPYYAFDANESTYCLTTAGGHIGYKFDEPIKVLALVAYHKRVAYADGSSTSHSNTAAVVSASNDGNTYTTIKNITVLVDNKEIIKLENNKSFSWWKITFNSNNIHAGYNNDVDAVMINEVQFYGR